MNVSAVAVKICGLTTVAQADAIAAMGAKAIGVIGVAATPRFIPEQQRRELFAHLHHRHPSVDRVWVVADLDDAQLNEALGGEGTPTVVQLHGNETPERCSTLRLRHPQTRWWKALRLRQPEDLDCLQRYDACVDALLLDAWSAEQLGGTGHRLDLSWLRNWNASCLQRCPGGSQEGSVLNGFLTYSARCVPTASMPPAGWRPHQASKTSPKCVT